MTANLLKNMMRVFAFTEGDHFYASDLGMNGGEISALSINGLIRPTGNVRKTMVPISTWNGDRIFKECTVKEWEVNPRYTDAGWAEMHACEICKAIKEAKELLAAARAMGIEGV